jgi:hypothetical protein
LIHIKDMSFSGVDQGLQFGLPAVRNRHRKKRGLSIVEEGGSGLV